MENPGKRRFICFGIESSCDETAAAVVADGAEILSTVVASQTEIHKAYGGVVPEVACRAHEEFMLPVIEQALGSAGLTTGDIDVVAVTTHPGLIGALLIGVSAAKALAYAIDKPLIAVNHVHAHIYAANLHFGVVPYPSVSLVVSGGHTSLFLSKSPTRHEMVGATKDDAAGEAFDKCAKIMGLGYPGGPAIEKTSAGGNPSAVPFPRSFLKGDSLDFSFSGVKTSVLYHCKGLNGDLAGPDVYKEPLKDLAASFQEAIADVLVAKVEKAVRRHLPEAVVVGGGVAANSRLRLKLAELGKKISIPVLIPPLGLCTDNAASVAGLGFHHWKEGKISDLSLDASPDSIGVGIKRKKRHI